MANETNTMPYNRDAEMALLGCLLIDNEIASELVEKLSEDDFYQESHKFILRAMRKVFNDRKPVDLVTVSDELDSEGNLVGDPLYSAAEQENMIENYLKAIDEHLALLEA